MTPENAQKCHDGTKIQTRRLIKDQPTRGVICKCPGDDHSFANFEMYKDMQTKLGWIPIGETFHAPFNVGEEAYIKEKALYWVSPILEGIEYDKPSDWWSDCVYSDDPEIPKLLSDNISLAVERDINKIVEGNPIIGKWEWKPSIFMPEHYARTVVEITDIRAQQIQSISEADAKAEGVKLLGYTTQMGRLMGKGTYRYAFEALWDSIHGKGAWKRNDWVWAYSFIRRRNETTESHRDTSSY